MKEARREDRRLDRLESQAARRTAAESDAVEPVEHVETPGTG